MSEFIVNEELVDDVWENSVNTGLTKKNVREILKALKVARPNLMFAEQVPPTIVQPAPPMPLQLPMQPAPTPTAEFVRAAFNAGRRSEIEGRDGDEAFRTFAQPLNIPVPPWSNAPYMPITDVGEAIREAEKIVRRANDKLNQLEKNSSLKEHERAALSAAITCMNQEGLQS